jgi:threonine dehydrogenase-like Zn-dependent dehydrogenase
VARGAAPPGARRLSVARVLIVGCGCRGRVLARELRAAGHAVRGTTRDPERLGEIEAAGAEAVVADPNRLGTLIAQLHGVSVVCWLMGGADGAAAADLHGPRLSTLLERLVDTPVRGVVYEAAGTVEPSLLARGAAAVREASATWSIPAGVVETDPREAPVWLAAMRSAVDGLLSGDRNAGNPERV